MEMHSFFMEEGKVRAIIPALVLHTVTNLFKHTRRFDLLLILCKTTKWAAQRFPSEPIFYMGIDLLILLKCSLVLKMFCF